MTGHRASLRVQCIMSLCAYGAHARIRAAGGGWGEGDPLSFYIPARGICGTRRNIRPKAVHPVHRARVYTTDTNITLNPPSHHALRVRRVRRYVRARMYRDDFNTRAGRMRGGERAGKTRGRVAAVVALCAYVGPASTRPRYPLKVIVVPAGRAGRESFLRGDG